MLSKRRQQNYSCRTFLDVVGVPSILHTDSLRTRLILAWHEGSWFKGGTSCCINEACSLSSHWLYSSRSLPAVPPRRHRPPRLAPQRAATPSPSPSRQQEWHLTLTLFLCLRAHMSRSPSRTTTTASHTIWHSTRQRRRQPSSTKEQGRRVCRLSPTRSMRRQHQELASSDVMCTRQR